uniref:Uncharacterized protein n=1 Tax=Anguilla anguilla TaxID=7936 RepID=A0A0E9PIH8_ANGAN
MLKLLSPYTLINMFLVFTVFIGSRIFVVRKLRLARPAMFLILAVTKAC